jgi:hypothetical protein
VPRFRPLLLVISLVAAALVVTGSAFAYDRDADSGDADSADSAAVDPDAARLAPENLVAVFLPGRLVWVPRNLAPASLVRRPRPPKHKPAGWGPNPEGDTTTVEAPSGHDVSPPLVTLLRPTLSTHPQHEETDSNPRVAGVGLPTPLTDTAVNGTSFSAAPSTATNFEGAHNTDGYVPPDTNGDVGGEFYVEWVNASFSVYDKNTGQLDSRMAAQCAPSPPTTVTPACAGNSIWAGFTGSSGQSLCSSANEGDPIVKFDRFANRWIFTQFAFREVDSGIGTGGPYYQCVAVSSGPDPLSSTYQRYAYRISKTNLNDYPKLGIWPDGYYFSFNLFSQSSGSFVGTAVAVADRTQILAGNAGARMIVKNLPTSTYSLLPADVDGASAAPPAGTPEQYAQLVSPAIFAGATDALQLFTLKVDWSAGSVTWSGPTQLATATFDPGPLDGTAWVSQPDDAEYLDALSDRLMYRLAYRNLGSREVMAVTHTVDGSSGSLVAAPRWYMLQKTGGGAWSIADQATYAPADGTSRWMGSVGLDHDGNMGMVYSFSSSTLYPSVAYTGRLTTDPAGSLETPVTIATGNQSQEALDAEGGEVGRWGDYASATVDPSDDCTFYVAAEYFAAGGEASPVSRHRNWHTRIGSFFFPGCMAFAPAAAGFGSQVVIRGKRFENASAVSFNGHAASTWTTNAAAHTLTVTVPGTATTGPITVTSPAGTVVSETSFAIVPSVAGFVPASGVPGDTVTITGGPFDGATGVKFNGTSATTFNVDTTTQITAKVPNGATTGRISVLVGAATGTSPSNFTVLPYVAGATPSAATVGTVVTIAGSGFTGATAVRFNGVSAQFRVNSNTSISARVPDAASYGPIGVTAPGGAVVSATSFAVIPTITGLSSTRGSGGSHISIGGSGFTGVASVTFNGTPAVFTVVNSGQIDATVPVAATSGPVVVTLAGSGRSAASGSFRAQPSLTAMSPASGPVGTTVVLTGTNLLEITTVSIGGVAAAFHVDGATKITLTIPAGASSNRITVNGAAGGAQTQTFTVTN